MKNFIFFVLISLLVVFGFSSSSVDLTFKIVEKPFSIVKCEKVIDGDTIVVFINNEVKTVRFLGVDTPESVKPGVEVQDGAIEASNFTKQLLGKTVILTYSDDKEDFFGRLLAYVWVLSDQGELVCWNLELIKQGYSELYTKYKFNGIEWFKEAIK
jgi:endonuclease YncB( thermonuclease family)